MSHPLYRHPLVIIGLVAMVLALFAAFGPSLWNENHTLTESAEAKSPVAIDKVVVAPPPAQPVPSADEDTAAVAVQEPVSPTVPETVASTSSSHPGSSSTADLFDRWGCYDNNHPEESQVEPDPAVKPYMFGSDNHPGSDAVRNLRLTRKQRI